MARSQRQHPDNNSPQKQFQVLSPLGTPEWTGPAHLGRGPRETKAESPDPRARKPREIMGNTDEGLG